MKITRKHSYNYEKNYHPSVGEIIERIDLLEKMFEKYKRNCSQDTYNKYPILGNIFPSYF